MSPWNRPFFFSASSFLGSSLLISLYRLLPCPVCSSQPQKYLNPPIPNNPTATPLPFPEQGLAELQ